MDFAPFTPATAWPSVDRHWRLSAPRSTCHDQHSVHASSSTHSVWTLPAGAACVTCDVLWSAAMLWTPLKRFTQATSCLCSRFSCERTQQTVALAPTPVLVGYSLVGVYPCAVWKPHRASSPCTTSTGPVRTRVAGTARNQPYPAQSGQVHHCQGHQEAPAATATTNTAAARVQPPQLLVTACSCNNNNTTAELQVATNTTPMVFVPFSMPSYAPPMAAGALYTNNCSPSKVTHTPL